jgi:hypothetical protein
MKFLFLGGNRRSGRLYCGMMLISKVFLEPFIFIVSPATKLFIVIFFFYTLCICMQGWFSSKSFDDVDCQLRSISPCSDVVKSRQPVIFVGYCPFPAGYFLMSKKIM